MASVARRVAFTDARKSGRPECLDLFDKALFHGHRDLVMSEHSHLT